MVYGLYVIRDNVAKESGFPFDAKNDGVAKRKFSSFCDELKKKDENLDCLSEFTLVCVGSFDSETMVLLACSPREIDMLGDDNNG